MESNKKGSRKEPSPSHDAKATASKKPIKIIRADDVSVSIFAHERETNGINRVNYSCSFQRSYKDSSGEWKRTQWFGLDDLGKVVTCAQQASEYIHGLSEQEAG